ncbi:hypothetical protein PTSG_00364 [Salpingoeca rosetta]|uniref:Cytochrome c oxidase assembly protein COX16 homolog, mitochondrial n=1 Tax=Salpingoeca rosetta (strain ATCC 50818 / BSB-021) TaxID=946362 RepID=F2TW97_SALR5|nr:uncharacterized protein PTSG_00364 [Salpingoeca rosetta]EGD72343.1 hypothetical protein PTSG_00364 [Salpingoeca rosetta]|eukprot:XP_004998913.1 hypothetical protein PTSG_00364 [Salpingoeca rosetta]
MSSRRFSNPFFRFGLPMLGLVVAGSLGLREFMSLRVTMRDEKARSMTDQEVQKLSNKPKQQFNIEGELRRLQAEMDIDKWEQTRVPRPEYKVVEPKPPSSSSS